MSRPDVKPRERREPGAFERRAERVLLGALLLFTLVAILATALGGCVQPAGGDDSPPGCLTNDDCAAGEVCADDGLCYGNPPAQHFAAELYAPAGSGLVRTDLGDIQISATGDLTLTFVQPVTVRGRVVLASDGAISVAAQVVFRRPSRIPGGPDVVFSANAVDGKFPGEVAFEVQLPPNDADETYEVSIYPDDGVISQPPDGLPTPAELVPPKRLAAVSITEDQEDVVFTLGDTPGLKQIIGRVVDAAARGLPGLTVRGYGRFLPLSPLERCSSRSHTDADGNFAIWVPESWDNFFDLRIEPMPGEPLPAIVRHDVFVEDPLPGQFQVVEDLGDIPMPSFAAAQEFQLPVNGLSAGGGAMPAAGATVRLSTTLPSQELSDEVTYTAEGVADELGYATVKLLPGDLDNGNRHYTVDVLPLPNMEFGGVWQLAVDVGPSAGVLAALPDLPRRVRASGSVYSSDGLPVADATVRMVPSAYYLYGLDNELRGAAQSIQWPTTTTTSDGGFVLYVDPGVLGIATIYDLEIVPTDVSLLPRWTIEQVRFDTITPEVNGDLLGPLGELWLPQASLAHGPVTDAYGAPVTSAEIRVYEVSEDNTLCATFSTLDACQPPARLRALTESDYGGNVRLVLPRP